ncbi:hypothetical protein SLS58_006414 [Diplodia intermedia]|uniref:Uncharacterized protein n=1 Tax=Diplodia intermedia TaxID=856260 RepID=A0ABR3TMW1_9PEZI
MPTPKLALNGSTSASHTSAAQQTPAEQERNNQWLRDQSLHRFSASSKSSSDGAAASTTKLPPRSSPQLSLPSDVPTPEHSPHSLTNLTAAETSAPFKTIETVSISSGSSDDSGDDDDSSAADQSTTSSPQQEQRDPTPPQPKNQPKKQPKKPRTRSSVSMASVQSPAAAPAPSSPKASPKPRRRRPDVSYSGGPPTEADRRNPHHRNRAILRTAGPADSDSLAIRLAAEPVLLDVVALEAERRAVCAERRGVDGALDAEAYVKKAIAGGWIEVVGRERIEAFEKGMGGVVGEEVVLRKAREGEPGEIGVDFFEERGEDGDDYEGDSEEEDEDEGEDEEWEGFGDEDVVMGDAGAETDSEEPVEDEVEVVPEEDTSSEWGGV